VGDDRESKIIQYEEIKFNLWIFGSPDGDGAMNEQGFWLKCYCSVIFHSSINIMMTGCIFGFFRRATSPPGELCVALLGRLFAHPLCTDIVGQ
jgi:hypothetical protein